MATTSGSGSGPDGDGDRPDFSGGSDGPLSDEQPTVVTPIPPPVSPSASPSDDVLPEFQTRAQRRQAAQGDRPLGTPSPLGRLFLPVAITVLCVIALLAAWKHLGDKHYARAAYAADAAAAASASAARALATPTPSPSLTHASPTPSPTPHSASPSPSASTHASATASPSASASASTSASPSASAHKVDRSVHVIVLNATGRTGLAARVAAKLAAKGWVITSIGNWTHGGITHTSIYVDGHANAAATMRGDFPYATGGVKKPWSQMSQSRITIVLASDYPR